MTTPLLESLANCALSRARLIGATGPCPRYWRELFSVTALIGAPWREADRLGESVMPRLYHVQFTTGPIELYAVSQAQAIATALELAGPGARVLRVWREGEW